MNQSAELANSTTYQVGLVLSISLSSVNTMMSVVNLSRLPGAKLIDPGVKIVLGLAMVATLLSCARIAVEQCVYVVAMYMGKFPDIAAVSVESCRKFALLLSFAPMVSLFAPLPLVFSLFVKIRSVTTEDDLAMGIRLVLCTIGFASAAVLASLLIPHPGNGARYLPVCDGSLMNSSSSTLLSSFVSIACNTLALYLAIVFPGIAGQAVCNLAMLLIFSAEAISQFSLLDLVNRAKINLYALYLPYLMGSLFMTFCLRKSFCKEKSPIEAAPDNEQEYRLQKLQEQWTRIAQNIVTPRTTISDN